VVGEIFTRRYSLLGAGGAEVETARIDLFSSEDQEVRYTTDENVRLCGTVWVGWNELRGVTERAEPRDVTERGIGEGRVVEVVMTVCTREILVSVIDVVTGQCFRTTISYN